VAKRLAPNTKGGRPVKTGQFLRGSAGLWLAPIAGWQLLFYLAPVAYVFLSGFWTMKDFRLTPSWTLANYRQILSEPMYYRAYVTSLGLSLGTVALTIALAYPLAYCLAFIVPRKHRPVLLVALIAPFWTNYLVRAYSWQTILANSGVLNYVLMALGIVKAPVEILFTHRATTIGLVHYLLAIMTLNLYTTLENIEPRLLEASQDLGANRLQTFFRVTLPLSSGGLVTGSMFIFVLAFADFVSPAVLGGQMQRVFPQLVVDAVQWTVNWPVASAFAVIMVATILLIAGLLGRKLNVTGGAVK